MREAAKGIKFRVFVGCFFLLELLGLVQTPHSTARLDRRLLRLPGGRLLRLGRWLLHLLFWDRRDQLGAGLASGALYTIWRPSVEKHLSKHALTSKHSQSIYLIISLTIYLKTRKEFVAADNSSGSPDIVLMFLSSRQ